MPNSIHRDIGKRLEKFQKVRKWTKKELAENSGIKPQAVNFYLNGEYDPLKLIETLMDNGFITNKDKSWLLSGVGNIFRNDDEKIEFESRFDGAGPTYSYPILSQVFAGEPEELAKEEIDEYYSFPYKKNSNRCFVLRVNGESMESTLSSGDLILCDMDAQLTENCLVAIKLSNGNQYIKRYREVNYAFIQLSSDNPSYDTRMIDKNDIVAIYRVVQSVRQH